MFLLVASVVAAAPTAEACASAAERAAPLQREGRFTQALVPLMVCVADACPRVVREWCRSTRAEVELQVPTVVFTVQDGSGVDLVAARIFIDGELVGAETGSPVPVNPGVHVIEARAEGHLQHRQEVAIRAGEKLRPLIVTLAPEVKPLPPPMPVVTRARFPLWPAVLTSSVALAGFGGFAGFGIHTRSSFEAMQMTCAPTCESSRVQSVRTTATIADGSLVAGSIAAGLSVVFWLLYGLQ